MARQPSFRNKSEHFECLQPSILKPSCDTNFDELFLVLMHISLVDEINTFTAMFSVEMFPPKKL